MRLITSDSRCDSFASGKGALKLSASLLVLASAGLAQPALAQDAQAEEVGEDAIIVTGFRESLQSAQNIKRNANSIVDSVTAEDIGALPDRSVTEALQRIPGVSINRFAAGIDPDHFSVEGSGVVVRGLTYVRSEFNGREAFSANNGRALSFADVPSELLGGVDVFKTPTADRIEGGIAGTVNLRTRKPFDDMGPNIAASLEMNYGDFAKQWSPTISFFGSNTWETPAGDFGLLGSYSYSRLFSRADRFQVSSFRVRQAYSDGTREDVIPFTGATPSREVIFPRGAVMGSQEFDRERYGYSAAAQWRSPDRSMEATFQFLRSDARQAWSENVIEIATDNVSNNGDSRAVQDTTIEFDDSGLFDRGTITGPTGWRQDQNTPVEQGGRRTPAMGLQSNNIARGHDEKLVTSDYAFNFKWDVTERFGLNFDYQHVDASTWLVDNGLWLSSYQDAQIDLNGNDFPDVRFVAPQSCPTLPCPGAPGSSANHPSYYTGDHQSFDDPYNSFYRAAMDHFEESEGNSDSFRIDADLSFPESGFLRSVQAGGYYSDRKQTARFSTYNWGRLSEQWGNGGPVWLDDPVDGVPGGTGGSVPNLYNANYFADFFRGQVVNPVGTEGRLFYGGPLVGNLQGYYDYASLINREWEPTTDACPSDDVVRNGGWNPLPLRCGVVPGTNYLPGEINPISEERKAAYIMANFDTDLSNGWNLSGNIGVRYSSTERNSVGVRQFVYGQTYLPTEATCTTPPSDASQEVLGFCAFPDATRASIRAFQNGDIVDAPGELDYDYWLPSANVKLEVGGGLQFRAAYFKGVAPPATGLIRNYFNVQVNAVQNVDSEGNAIPGDFRPQANVSAGNPFLLPVEADNFDLTAEWYFDRVGQISIAAFYKRLKNVLTNTTVRTQLTNNGETFDALVTAPGNAPETGKIKGFEISYQQTYSFLPSFLSGLGLQANYTYVDSSGVPQSTLSETDPDVGAGRVTTVNLEDLPLQGLSKHTINITPFLDIGPVSLRASYNWRSEFLLTIRDVIVPYDPIYQRDYGQLDASVSFAIDDSLRVGVQGVNLLNSVTKTSAVIEDQNDEIRLVPRGWYMNDRRFTLFARFNF